MKFEVVKNSKSLTRCLDAVVKTDNDKCLSFEEVNEFVKTDNLLDYLTDGNFVTKTIGVKIVTTWSNGEVSTMKKDFIVRQEYLYLSTNYKKKFVRSIVQNNIDKYFELECSEVNEVSCYIYIDDYKNDVVYDYLVRTVTPDEFKTSNKGGKQKVTREVEQSWSESVDKLVAYRGLPSDSYINRYLTSCRMYASNRDKAAKSSRINELLQIPLKQSSEKQQAYLLKLLNGQYTDLDVSLLNTYQSGALIDNLTYESASLADCVQKDEEFLELYTFFIKRQNEGIKNF